jgi:hypothetical protein
LAFRLAACLSVVTTAPAFAQRGPLEQYNARLSARDHFNSFGERITSAAAIIRQDRANVHRFGLRDRGDELDSFFASAANRAALERLLAHGRMSAATRDAIVNGEPLIHVDIYAGYVVVTLL